MMYLVEFMEGETVVASKSVEANTPLKAASIATQRNISIIYENAAWVRVTPPGCPPLAFGYADVKI